MAEQTEIRKLAAVMFTDLEGYTSMFQKNEPSALDKIHIHRQYLEEITASHHGQIIQFYGDGSLVVFDSVMDAIRSAIEIHNVSKKWKILVRIGIHVGDVVFRDKDVFGDAVNIASRIQTVGVPGSIVISGKVSDEIQNQPDIGISSLGKFSLKNENEPLELFAVTGHGLKIPDRQKILDTKKSKSLGLIISVVAFIIIGGYVTKYFLEKKAESLLKDEKIAVPPFENFTNRPELNSISQMAAHWITTELIESADANVVSYQ